MQQVDVILQQRMSNPPTIFKEYGLTESSLKVSSAIPGQTVILYRS